MAGRRVWAAEPLYDEQAYRKDDEVTGVFDAEQEQALILAGVLTTVTPSSAAAKGGAEVKASVTTTRKRAGR